MKRSGIIFGIFLLALALLAAPAFAADKVEPIWTATYVYLCSATNTWVRAALATWP